MTAANGKYGAGLRPAKGTDRVLIKDEYGLIYGWHTLEAIKDSGSAASVPVVTVKEIDVDMFVAYLEAYYRHTPEIAAILDKLSGASTIVVDDLRAIDRLIILYEQDAVALAQLKIDALAGKIPGIDPTEYLEASSS